MAFCYTDSPKIECKEERKLKEMMNTWRNMERRDEEKSDNLSFFYCSEPNWMPKYRWMKPIN